MDQTVYPRVTVRVVFNEQDSGESVHLCMVLKSESYSGVREGI